MGGLVEEQEARPGGQRDADLQGAPLTVRQSAGAAVLASGQTDSRQNA